MQYASVPSASPLPRLTDDLVEFARAQEVEAAVSRRLASLDKGPVLQASLLALPVLLAAVSFAGGLATVYASTDCRGTKFGTYSRAFLYTSLTHSLVAPALAWAVQRAGIGLLRRPGAAFAVYCAQAAVLASFLVAMVVLLGLVWRTACPSVREKARSRLRLG